MATALMRLPSSFNFCVASSVELRRARPEAWRETAAGSARYERSYVPAADSSLPTELVPMGKALGLKSPRVRWILRARPVGRALKPGVESHDNRNEVPFQSLHRQRYLEP